MHSTWPKIHKSKLTEIEEDRDIGTPRGQFKQYCLSTAQKKQTNSVKDSQDLNNRIKKHNSTDT